ncbi:6-bladed beta-propeller [Candidatus Neomarinimicrobiota bacterium]
MKVILAIAVTAVMTLLGTGCAVSKTVVPDLVWPDPPDQPRIQLVDIIESQYFSQETIWEAIKRSLLGADPAKRLVQPFGVEVDTAGRVYIADTGGGSVVVFDMVEEEIRHIGVSGRGRLLAPFDLEIVGDKLFVSDSKMARVHAYNQEGDLVLVLGNEGGMGRPSGVRYDPLSNRLYVVDTGMHNIRVYDAESWDLLFTIGQRGSGDGEFNFPTMLDVKNGKLYVVDSMNFRVQVLDQDGGFINKFSEAGDAPGYLYRPKGIAATSDGFLFVVDSAFNNFQIFDEEGNVYMFVGEAGSAPGYFNQPTGIMYNNNLLYVVDQRNHRVQVFEFLGSD